MTVSIVDGATRVAFAAATFQQAQCEAVVAPWGGGNVTARVLGSGGALRQTITLGPWTIAPTTPREVRHGARLAFTTVSAGDIERIEYRTAGGVTIFTASAGQGATAAAVDFAGPIRNLCGITLAGAVFTANPSLPVLPPVTPVPGGRVNVNLNSADSVDYDIQGSGLFPGNVGSRWWLGYLGTTNDTIFRQLRGSYSGCVWAEEYGPAGASICFGGGHGVNVGYVAYLFDAGSLQWRQVGAPRNLPSSFEWAGYLTPPTGPFTLAADQRDSTFFDFEHNGSRIAINVHSYLQNVYIPPADAGNTLGALLITQRDATQEPSTPRQVGEPSRLFAPAKMDLDTGANEGRVTRAVTEPVPAPAGVSSWFTIINGFIPVRDSTRRRLWYFIDGGAVRAKSTDLTQSTYTTWTDHVVQRSAGGNADWLEVINSTWLYVPDADCMISFSPATGSGAPVANGALDVRLYSMATGVPVKLPVDRVPDGVMPRGGAFVGAAWVPASVVGGVGKFYVYEGRGDTFMHTLTPSSLDWATCTWTWGRESFTGPTPVARNPSPTAVNTDNDGIQGALSWVPARGALMLHDGALPSGVCFDGVTRNGLVQFWYPPGTPI